MKFSLIVAAFAGLVPQLAQATALPNPAPAGLEGIQLAERTTSINPILEARNALWKREDEWTIVIYEYGDSENQCGGTVQTTSGSGSACVGFNNLPSVSCIDVNVSLTSASVKCTFQTKSPGSGNNCDGTNHESFEVDKGKGAGDHVDATVRFVSVSCEL